MNVQMLYEFCKCRSQPFLDNFDVGGKNEGNLPSKQDDPEKYAEHENTFSVSSRAKPLFSGWHVTAFRQP